MSTDNTNRPEEYSVDETSNAFLRSSETNVSPHDTLSVSSVQPIADAKTRLLSWLGLGALFVVALVVIFILPSIVEKYELPLAPRLDPAEIIVTTPSVPPLSISPFQEAQISKSRREAQDKLATLLENQSRLQQVNVEQWAEQSYLDSVGAASSGR
jgi:hypothetical protein